MTIKFICTCGKHLRARDEMAMRRSLCPRCGSPVGIPSLKPTLPGGESPMTPQERLRHALARKPLPGSDKQASDAETPAVAAPAPVNTRIVRLLSSRAQRPPDPGVRHLEKHWYECLLYPLRAWRLCVMLALFLAVLGGSMALILPPLLNDPEAAPLWVVILCSAWAVLLLFGLPCSFLECVVNSAAAGEVYYIRWSGNLLVTLVLSGAKWFACFLSGPIVFSAIAVVYWLSCGDPSWLDRLILTELGVIAVGYWLFALLSVTERGRMRDVNPLAVIDLAHRLGWRGLVVVAVAALVLLAHGGALLAGVAEVHSSIFFGVLVLTGAWTSAVFWSTFFCRLLGVWCHRSRATSIDPAPERA